MAGKRDISPLGASRFERPYRPPSRATPTTSPIDPTHHDLPFARYNGTGESAPSTVASYSRPPANPDALDNAALYGQRNHRAGQEQRYLSPPVVDDEYTDDEDDEYQEERDSGVGSLSGNDAKAPTDFSLAEGMVSDKCPDAATLQVLQNSPLFDAEGRETRFGALFDPETAAGQRQLIIFLRWAFCPSCTGYLTALAKGIGPEEHSNLSVPTSITIINCGQPDLLKHYQQWTGCIWPLYSGSPDLYKRLGFKKCMNLGKVPDYTTKGLMGQSRDEIKLVSKSLKDPEGIRKRDLLKGGHPMQVGGEVLFENGRAVWCHRMRDYRGHAEIAEPRLCICAVSISQASHSSFKALEDPDTKFEVLDRPDSLDR